MSELLNKAAAFEEKEKWKNAADTYFKAADELIAAANPNEAKSAYIKALANAEKAEIYSLVIESIFSYVKLASEDEKKEILTKAFAPLDILLTEAVTKKKYNDIFELMSKKEQAARITNLYFEETLVEKGKYLQEYAWGLIINKKIEERKKAFEALSKASDVFLEMDKKNDKIEGEFQAIKYLFDEGFLKEGLQLYNELVDFCYSNGLIEQAENVLLLIVEYANDILSGKGSKKLLKEVKVSLSETDPGGELLNIGIEKAQSINSPAVIAKAADILSEYAQQLFDKKKYVIALNFYDKALKLIITINQKDSATSLSQEIVKKAYFLLDQKGKFKSGLDYFTIINQLEQINLEALGDFLYSKADYLFNQDKIDQALDDYVKSAEAFLSGNIIEKFSQSSEALYTKALTLIERKKFSVAYNYVNNAIILFEGNQAFEKIGLNTTLVAKELIKAKQIKEAEVYSIKAVEYLINARNILEAGKAHRSFGESFISLEQYDTASFHFIEAAKMFKEGENHEEIISTSNPLLISAKNKLSDGKKELAQNLIKSATLCAEQKGPIDQINVLMEFIDHAVFINNYQIALDNLIYATKILGISFPAESKKLVQKLANTGKRLIVSDQQFVLGKDYVDQAIRTLVELKENLEGSNLLLEFGHLLFDHNQNELAKNMLLQIPSVLGTEIQPDFFSEKTSLAAKTLISFNFITEGIELLRRAIGTYVSLGSIEPIIELTMFCSERAKLAIESGEIIFAKHLYISAMEFSLLANLEVHDQILSEATNTFLELDDFYSVREFHDYAKNNLEGEKDYLVKLGRLIIFQGGNLRENKNLFDEASDFIRTGIKIINQTGMLAEAGEAALAQGNAFIEKDHFVFGEELIETGAQIFLQIKDIDRSGDAFLSLAEINLHRQQWKDAFRQVELANKSFLEARNYEKLSNSILKTTDIGLAALIFNHVENREFSIKCFEKAISLAKTNQLPNIEIETYLREGRAFTQIKDYKTAYNVFLQAVTLLEQTDEKEKSPIIAEELSNYALTFISENEIQLGLYTADLSTGISLRLGQPISASEVYMKTCNALLKMNQIVEGVKLVLLASDTLMVANEFEQASKILEEIVDLLYSMKDYKNASIVTGQIVTVHQKTGDLNKQKKAITKLVEKAKEVIADGKIMDGEELWESASNYSISTNIEFALETNSARIENLMTAGMYNSINNAFHQVLAILENEKEKLLAQGDRVNEIARSLFMNDEIELSKNFILTAVEFYKKSENHDKAKDFCIEMSEEFINKNDETNGIELIDHAAAIANEKQGSHEAAKIYLNSGFVLIERGFQKSGQLAVNKAIDIEIQTKNTQGCIELGEISLQRAAEMTNTNLEIATKYYGQASIIFERAGSFTRAGEASVIISTNSLSLGNAAEALEGNERAIDLFLKDRNIDLATASLKQTIEAARRFFDDNEITKAVLILEKSRFLVEKVTKFELLDLIVSIYLYAASQNLPNRKSAIGMFFLNRAIELAITSPDPEEYKKVVDLSLKLSLEIIKKKNSLAGARVIEKIAQQDITKERLLHYVTDTYLEAIKQTLEVEWNMISKITRVAIRFFNETNQEEMVSQVTTILVKRANADILLNKPQLGFFFLDHVFRLLHEFKNQELMMQIGLEVFEQLLVMGDDSDLYNNYKMLGYCYQIFQEVQNLEYIERVGLEFVKLGSKDLVGNMQSIRGYEALLTARDIAVKTQSDTLMSTVVLALLDFAKQLSTNNTMTALSTIDDIIDGLSAFEIPKSNRAQIDYNIITSQIKSLVTFGEKVSKTQENYKTGRKIIEGCMRVLSLSKNHSYIDNNLLDIQKDTQKLLKRANREAAYRLRHGALVSIDNMADSNIAISIAENSFRTAQVLFDKRKYYDSMDFLDSALKISDTLSLSTELKNIGLFALSAGDQLVNDGKILESMIYYDIAVEAFDIAKDEENSNRLVNRIFQTREWDADISIAYRVYKIASESAIRTKSWRKAHEIATKCFNRGIAFIDQPRIPSNLTLKFISLSGKIFEDIGAIRDAANTYDNAILKYIRLMKSRKNIDQIIAELMTKTAVTRMASCDMDSLETIFLRVMELAEMKKVKFTKTIARTLKLINSTKVGDAWDLIASLPFVSHGRIRKIINATKGRIIYDLQQKGTFDRTVLSTTDRSLPLSDYLIDSLLISRKIVGQPINKDVFISMDKIRKIREFFYSEYELWGRIELEAISTEFGIQPNDAASIVRREFLSALYMGTLDNDQKVFYSFDRLKAEIDLILNREKKKETRFDPLQAANEMKIPPDIIKEVLREISCNEVVKSVAD
jgi:tetratricopeptide (TPR) repeat protein